MYNREYTPDRISELKENEIFVFGSNLAGFHGGGAAHVAYKKFGAVWGQGVGLQGQSYAIPTMQGGVETIKPYVDEFIEFAKAHPEYKFLVTLIGCGIAGFLPSDIAPLFNGCHGGGEHHSAERVCWLAVELRSSLLTLGKADASIALLSLNRSLHNSTITLTKTKSTSV